MRTGLTVRPISYALNTRLTGLKHQHMGPQRAKRHIECLGQLEGQSAYRHSCLIVELTHLAQARDATVTSVR